jgi:hypothetical protein
MQELFHMITGTSTGAILAGTLAVKNDPASNSSYYASDVVDFFMNDGPEIFQDRKINYGLLGIIVVISGLIIGWWGYKIGVRIFANPKVEKNLKHIRMLIKELK